MQTQDAFCSCCRYLRIQFSELLKMQIEDKDCAINFGLRRKIETENNKPQEISNKSNYKEGKK